MAAKACLGAHIPSSSKTVIVGSNVRCHCYVNNCGDARGNFYGEIFKNGYRCDSKHNEYLDPGEHFYIYGTPCTFDMPNSTVKIRFAGGHAEGSEWKPDYSETITLTPKIATGSIYATSVPTGASIRVDNSYKGIAPITIPNISVGSHKVTCYKSGYEHGYCWVNVKADTTVTANCVLTKLEGYIDVRSTPTGANIYLNGVLQSYKTNHKFLVSTGTYTIKVTKTGYKTPSTKQVTLYAGDTKIVSFTLEEECNCGDWIEGECISTTHRRYTRTCNPSGCDTETEDRPDSTCAAPPTCSDYTDEESCISAGCYWYDDACHEEPPSEFNLICWSATDALIPNYERESVEVRANIQTGLTCLLGYRIDGVVTITIKNLTTSKEYTADTDETGYIGYYFPFTDCVEGDNEFQLVSGDVTSENKIVDLKLECDVGAIITIKDIPTSGLRVQGTPALTYIGALEKEVTPDYPTVTFDSRDSILSRPHPGEKWKFRVLRDDDWVLDETKTKITIPETGCQPVTLNGWNGCKWRTLLTGPSEAILNESFQIKAVLKQTPNILVGEDWNVDFYEGDISGIPIWTGGTDEYGVALCTVPAKPTLGTYTFFAKQSDAPTYCEPLTGLSVEVLEYIPPEGIWASIIQFIVDTFGVEPEQAKTIAYAVIGLVALLFLSSMFKR